MKISRIILVKDLSVESYATLDEIFKHSTLRYQISLPNQAVIIEGDNDDAYQARKLLIENNFIVE